MIEFCKSYFKFVYLFCILGNFFCLVVVCWLFSKNPFGNAIRVSSGLDPDQDNVLWVLVWGQTVCKSSQQTTKVATRLARKKLKTSFHIFVQITKKLWSVTVFTILICCSWKKGFRHFFTFTCTIKPLTNTDVRTRPANFAHSASIFWERKIQRSLIRGRGTSIIHIM